MTQRRRRKCLNCGQLFRPDPRNLRHQRYCSAPVCRKASKAASQARWLAKRAGGGHHMLLRHLRNGVQRVVELDDGFHRFTVGDLAAALNGARLESPGALAGPETSDDGGAESGAAASDDRGAKSGGDPAGVVIDGRWHTPDTPLSSVAPWA